MSAPLAPTDFERGMASAELRLGLTQAEHHLSGLGSAVGSIVGAIRAGARPRPGMSPPDSLACTLRELADRLDAAASTASVTSSQRAAA